ncbi:MAG: DUF4365 domain-containing protein [Crocinitomicaceae bacterium]|nr:DUF4365 domain-containing protein [Crocinitomicaceae bacterium]
MVPDEWNVVELHPDYGKDYMVEIFENEISTGKIFYVQLKGSDQKIKDNAFHLQMQVEDH